MFYEFNQNNSGGSFDVTDTLCHRLLIQADNEKDAILVAESLGCYWNGCDSGTDCDCCGDRWSKDFIDEIPESDIKYDDIVFQNVEQYAQHFANEYGWTTPDCRIFYKNGKVKEIFTCKK